MLPPDLDCFAGIVFDKDGTLTDLNARWGPFSRSYVDAFAAAIDGDPIALGAAIGLDGDRLRPNSIGAVGTGPEVRAALAAAAGQDSTALTAAFAAASAGATFGPLTPLGRVAESFAHLRALGLRVGIATSDHRRNTLHEVAELGIADRVDGIRCADDGPPKPDPWPLTSLAVEWGIAIEDLLFVGDADQDRRTAEAAGAHFRHAGEAIETVLGLDLPTR